MGPYATSVCGLKLLMYEALSFYVYAALSYQCMGLTLLVHEVLSY